MALTGINGLLADPNSASTLGLAQGLLASAGASRLPITMGQALSTGIGGMQQARGTALQQQGMGLNNAAQAYNLQMQKLRMDMMQQAFGRIANEGGSQPSAVSSVLAAGATAAPNTVNADGSQTNNGGVGPTNANASLLAKTQQSEQPQASLFGMTPKQMFDQGQAYLMLGLPGGSNMMTLAAQYDPTLQANLAMWKNPTVAEARYAYGGDQNAAQGALRNIITAQGSKRLGNSAGIVGGQLVGLPGTPTPGYTYQPNGNNGWDAVPIGGGLGAVKTGAQAESEGKSAGKAQNTLTQVWDPTAFNGKGGYVSRPVSQVVQAASGAPSPVVTPSQQADRDAEAVSLLQQEMQVQQQKLHSAKTPQDVSLAQANIAALQRQIQHYGGTSTAATTSPGALPTQPPPGYVSSTTTAQNASSKLMDDQQSELAGQDNVYQQSRQMLDQMIALAKGNGDLTTPSRFLPEDIATRLSNNAAEYQKAHANFVALQGKALGSGGTDASRATIDEAVPMWDKPQAAKLEGLTNQLNQLDLAHIKRQVLSPVFQQGNEKAYTNLSSQFDATIKPGMMPTIMQVLQMGPTPQRSQLLAKIKASSPQEAQALNMLAQYGVLK